MKDPFVIYVNDKIQRLEKEKSQLRDQLIDFYVAVMGTEMASRIPETIKKVEELIIKTKENSANMPSEPEQKDNFTK